MPLSRPLFFISGSIIYPEKYQKNPPKNGVCSPLFTASCQNTSFQLFSGTHFLKGGVSRRRKGRTFISGEEILQKKRLFFKQFNFFSPPKLIHLYILVCVVQYLYEYIKGQWFLKFWRFVCLGFFTSKENAKEMKNSSLVALNGQERHSHQAHVSFLSLAETLFVCSYMT